MLKQFRRSFLSSPVFVARAHAVVDKLQGNAFWKRKGEVKNLVEEVLPISGLLKHLYVPGREVRCRLAQPDLNYDAELRFTGREVTHGFLAENYFVEVTTAASALNYLYRESLATNGYAFGGTKIARVGSKHRGGVSVNSQASVVDPSEIVTDAIKWIRERITAKNAKTYPAPCILIVNLDIDRPLNTSEWTTIVGKVCDCADRKKFARIYVVRWTDSSVFAV